MIANILNSVGADTIFAVVVSLSIFILGLIFKWGYDSWKRKKYLKSRVNFFIESSESLIKPIKKQAEEFKKLSESISDINNRKLAFNVVTDLNFFFYYPEIIAEIHSYNTLKWRNKIDVIDTLKKTSKVINAIQSQFDHTRYNFGNFMRKQDRNADDWHEAINSVFRFHDFLINQYRLQGEPKEDKFFHDFCIVIFEWTKERDDFNLEHVIEKLVLPLKEVCKNYSGDTRALQILPVLNRCTNVFERFSEHRKNYSDLFENDCKQLTENLSTYEEAISELKELT